MAKVDMNEKVATDPKAAAEELLERYRRARCNFKSMSLALGVTHWVARRWAAKLDAAGQSLTVKMAAMRDVARRDGWLHDGYTHGGNRGPDRAPRKRRAVKNETRVSSAKRAAKKKHRPLKK